ncbi:Lycopene epsilon cyclase, chloroplastic [Capsicum annuum]|nr:Lycopene epsilon cyclase, chloroplastic [Capsicum annuum]
MRKAKVEEFMNLRKGSVTAKEYYLKFNQLAKYAPNLIVDPRASISKIVTGVFELVLKECRTAMLNRDMYLARMMMHAHQIEADKAKVKERMNKKARIASVPASKFGDISYDGAPGSKALSSTSCVRTNLLCKECGKSHLGVCRVGSDMCFGYVKNQFRVFQLGVGASTEQGQGWQFPVREAELLGVIPKLQNCVASAGCQSYPSRKAGHPSDRLDYYIALGLTSCKGHPSDRIDQRGLYLWHDIDIPPAGVIGWTPLVEIRGIIFSENIGRLGSSMVGMSFSSDFPLLSRAQNMLSSEFELVMVSVASLHFVGFFIGTFDDRKRMIETGEGIEWAVREALAFTTFLVEGNHIRLSGQDVETDLVVISHGPIGFALATELAKLGFNVGLVGPDLSFTNNYGVWEDEFKGVIHFNLPMCVEVDILYLNLKADSIVEAINIYSLVECEGNVVISCRFVTVVSGAASGKFLQYELGGPRISIQIAYRVEVEVDNYPYDLSLMVFMDYKDYVRHSAQSLEAKYPTFLYAMPMTPTRKEFKGRVIHINLPRCVEESVLYLNSKVDRIIEAISVHSLIECEGDVVIPCRFVIVVFGAASGKFLQYELGGPKISIQTTYEVEVKVDNNPYDPILMVFMDYRDYVRYDAQSLEAKYLTFLYAMPMTPTRVF